jgi:predicted DNA-binding ribbon-helix-helix protein
MTYLQEADSAPMSTLPGSVDVAGLLSWPLVAARTVQLSGRRVRLRLETAVWETLDAVALQDGRTLGEVCDQIDGARPSNTPLTSALRNFVLSYYMNAEMLPIKNS